MLDSGVITTLVLGIILFFVGSAYFLRYLAEKLPLTERTIPELSKAKAALKGRHLALGIASLSAAVYPIPLLIILGMWLFCSLTLVECAFKGYAPNIFKRQKNKLSKGALVYLLPYLIGAWILHALRRSEAPLTDEIAPNIYIGGHVLPNKPWVAVLDLTCEYPGTSTGDRDIAYLNLPWLDGTAAPEGLLARAKAFIDTHYTKGPVYIHCAIGRFRSARTIAYWLQHSLHMTETEAWQLLKSKRPVVVVPPHIVLPD